MRHLNKHGFWLLGGALVLVLVLAWSSFRFAAEPAVQAGNEPPTVRMLPAAANLRIHVLASSEKPERLLDAAAAAWSKAQPTALLLNRTPRIYQTEPAQDRPVPVCEVRAIRAGNTLCCRMQWDDPTRNEPVAPPARTGAAGEPKLLYKRPTAETATFPDALAVMVPEQWAGPRFPSLLMGDKDGPAFVYYWSASRGAEVLKASGRATPQPTSQKLPFRAAHHQEKWTVTLQFPDQPAGYPIAFAIWDGQFGDRDGLKFFSIWYVLAR